ncbi:MAG: protein phosphatase CheZ [Deltaproteobacteria bacterium]|nr:protein phosphatase CheZ [Deltaproteobacteria bacterium]MBW2128230.1 protein phosphatase CheZ [Deltaproteobacteria bacterium]
MGTILMGNIGENQKGIAFQAQDIVRIIRSGDIQMVSSNEEPGVFLDIGGQMYPVREKMDKENLKPYFILHKSGDVLNVEDYRLLFNTRDLDGGDVEGVDVDGKAYRCMWYDGGPDPENSISGLTLNQIEEKLRQVEDPLCELKDLKDMVLKLKQGEFYEALTMEFSGKIKEIAQELIEFRKDIQSRIEPGIVEIAARDIPEASYQLEGINQTLESSTMKIMDINEEQLEIANKRLERLTSLFSGNGGPPEAAEEALEILKEDIEILKRIGNLSMSMMEPLSFQDLVGQRIQRIIKLVKSMEARISDLVISFGIKIQKHRENPEKSYEDLKKDVEVYKSELKGPQLEGEGLKQEDIDELLATL